MKVRIVGGGPAGLFFAYLMGRAGGHDIRVYERDAEGATYGWGLVFSDVALSFVREIAPRGSPAARPGLWRGVRTASSCLERS